MTTDLEQQFSIHRFEAAQIDPDNFGHAAHVYVAWLYINQYGLRSALPRYDRALRRLTKRLGVPEKYHATITGFLLTAIAARIDDNESWPAFCANNPAMIGDSRSLLARNYTEARLYSSEARRRFVPPDRLAV